MAIYLKESEVAELLSLNEAIEAIEEAHRLHAIGEAVDLPRQRVRLPGCFTHLLQGAIPSLGITGFKVYTSTKNETRFWVHLYSLTSGAPLAVIEGELLGAIRTGAAGAIAIKYFSRSDARVLTVFGAGKQGEWQIRASCQVRGLTEIRVVAKHLESAKALCQRLTEEEIGKKLQIIPFSIEEAEHAVKGADIVVTATTSAVPVFSAEWLSAGVHVNAIGSNSLIRQEIPENFFRRVDLIVVDSREVALRESGDLLPILEKGRTRPSCWIELGEAIAGLRPGRQDEGLTTLFESQGMAIQDLAVAAVVFKKAEQRGLGERLPF